MTDKFVLGFVFDKLRLNVLLMTKNRPTPQVGKLNGIGGRILADELASAAMEREAYEEAGLTIPADHWIFRAMLIGPQFNCEVFYAYTDHMYNYRQRTDERIRAYRSNGRFPAPLVPDVPVLITLGTSPGDIDLMQLRYT